MTLPKECLAEMRMRDRKNPMVNLMSTNNPATVLSCERYSNLRRLLRVTAWVLRFVNAVKKNKPLESSAPIQDNGNLAVVEIQQALTYWLKVSPSCMPNFQQWSKQYGLFRDGIGLWRCGGRLDNSEMPQAAKRPILLDKEHYLTLLITRECHERVRHGGVKATLTELQYWIVRGRCFIKRILCGCAICHRFQGKPYPPPPAPPLPSFRVSEARPFSYTGIDFAGPLYIRDMVTSATRKVWICLYTYCVT